MAKCNIAAFFAFSSHCFDSKGGCSICTEIHSIIAHGSSLKLSNVQVKMLKFKSVQRFHLLLASPRSLGGGGSFLYGNMTIVTGDVADDSDKFQCLYCASLFSDDRDT